MAELFNTDRTSINRHIRNIFQTQELYENSTCAKIAQVRLEGGRSIKRVVPYYNLDMIISVGYRVNSISGTRFRQWANSVLKEHMLRGFSVNQRLVAHENRLENIDSRVIYLEKQVDFFVKANEAESNLYDFVSLQYTILHFLQITNSGKPVGNSDRFKSRASARSLLLVVLKYE